MYTYSQSAPSLPQANYGGIKVSLPQPLKAIYNDEDNSLIQEEGGVASTPNDPEVEMNWNICNYLPESGSCQDIFRVCEMDIYGMADLEECPD